MKCLKVLSALVAVAMMASMAQAAPVAITNGDLDDTTFGFSQGVPAGWSTTGASWYGNGGNPHTGSGAFYMNGNGFPGPAGGNLFQDVSAAVSAAFGGLTTGTQYTLTTCAWVRGSGNPASMTLGVKQFSATGISGTTTAQSKPVALIGSTYQLWTHTQTFTYLGGSLWLDARTTTPNPTFDTFSLSTGAAHGGTTGPAVPEPSSIGMLALGLMGLGFLGYRKVRK